MSSPRGSLLVGLLGIVLAACGQMRLSENTTLVSSSFLGVAWSQHDEYTKPSAIDPNDFTPNTKSMTLSDHNATPFELSYDLDLRWRPVRHWSFGLTSNCLTFYLDNAIEDGGMSFYDQKIRYTELSWWDMVTAEDIILSRTPSLGFALGYIFGDQKNEEDRFIIQYAITAAHYSLDLQKYKGYDCVNCQNSSDVKETIKISGGAAVRQAVDLGIDTWRVRFWLEMDGTKQFTAGTGIVVWSRE
jgi:hypothetical protein